MAAVLAGAGLAVSFPPVGWWWLAPAALAVWLLAGYRRSAWVGTGLGFLTGLAFFGVHVRWLAVVGSDAWLLLAAYCALWYALVGWGNALVTRLRWWPLWIACLWVGQEALRGRYPLGGFPWGRLAFGQADSPLAPYASLAGAPAITFATALIAALVAVAVMAAFPALAGRDAAPSPSRRPGRWGRTVLALGGAVLVAVAARAVPLPIEGQDGGGPAYLSAAVVQGNVPELGLGFNDQARAVLANHVRATEDLAARVAAGEAPAPDFVVWPENASDVDPYLDPVAAREIQGAVDEIGAPTLVGAVVINQADPRTVLNVGIVWSPGTGPGDRYVKRHPVPFGEYVPFRSVLAPLVGRFDRIPRDFAPGDRIGVLTLGPARVGVVICFEVAYDREVRDAVVGDGATPGGRLLVVQTNNATYGRTGQPDQQLAMSRLRAIEHGRTVLVAATSGISAVIAPDGRVLAQAGEATAATLSERVALRDSLTPADRLGAWPEAVAALAGLLACLAALATRRRPARGRVGRGIGSGRASDPDPPAPEASTPAATRPAPTTTEDAR